LGGLDLRGAVFLFFIRNNAKDSAHAEGLLIFSVSAHPFVEGQRAGLDYIPSPMWKCMILLLK
jgi:hypothetical protein